MLIFWRDLRNVDLTVVNTYGFIKQGLFVAGSITAFELALELFWNRVILETVDSICLGLAKDLKSLSLRRLWDYRITDDRAFINDIRRKIMLEGFSLLWYHFQIQLRNTNFSILYLNDNNLIYLSHMFQGLHHWKLTTFPRVKLITISAV